MQFYKYHGAGNDFILVDQRQHSFVKSEDQTHIAQLCDRHFGIGADGLILLQEHPAYDFEMIYFNADGRPSSMCGNGGRCIVSFAHRLGIIGSTCRFLAIDGPHEARVISETWIELKMADVAEVEIGEGYYFLDTGSPHYVRFVNDLNELDVVVAGRAVRYNERFAKAGTNVNFIESRDNGIAIGTYERGVEDETLACGTGVTAAAISAYFQHGLQTAQVEIPVRAKGGDLVVRYRREAAGFTDVWLCGPVAAVFVGEV